MSKTGWQTAPTMFSMILLIIAVLLLLSCDCGKIRDDVQINIDSPKEGDFVEQRYMVKGRISDPEFPVYVLVHPIEADQWWVQRIPEVAGNGVWQSLCFFGTADKGRGEQFEVLALVCKKHLREGQTIKTGKVPQGGLRSEIITVTRLH